MERRVGDCGEVGRLVDVEGRVRGSLDRVRRVGGRKVGRGGRVGREGG